MHGMHVVTCYMMHLPRVQGWWAWSDDKVDYDDAPNVSLLMQKARGTHTMAHTTI